MRYWIIFNVQLEIQMLSTFFLKKKQIVGN